MQIGDRYKWQNKDRWLIWEISSKAIPTVIDAGRSMHMKGQEFPLWTVGNYDTYMGNFSKSDNFSNLYLILNEETAD